MATSLAVEITRITQSFGSYSIFVHFIIGVIGSVINILIFTRLKLFKGNRCAFYLTLESVSSLGMFVQIFIPQMFQNVYGINLTNQSRAYCKFQVAVAQAFRVFIDSIICFEAFDQYMSTHYRFSLRQMSTIKLARRLTIVTTIICVIQTIPYFIFYDLVPPFGCIIIDQGMKYYYSFVYYIFLNGLAPIAISCLFSALAYRNVRRLVRRQIPVLRRKLDRQLTAMVFARVIFFIVFVSPYTIFRIYIVNVDMTKIDSLHYSIVQLLGVIGLFMGSLAYTVNFYIFFATSLRFRRQVWYLFAKLCWQPLKRCLCSNVNRVHPASLTSNISAVISE